MYSPDRLGTGSILMTAGVSRSSIGLTGHLLTLQSYYHVTLKRLDRALNDVYTGVMIVYLPVWGGVKFLGASHLQVILAYRSAFTHLTTFFSTPAKPFKLQIDV